MLIEILCCLVILSSVANAQNNKTSLQSDYNSFSNLFNHNLWTINGNLNITSSCASDINQYLFDLKELQLWALQANLASARSFGHFLMEKDFWMGQPEKCKGFGFEYFMAHVFLKVNSLRDQSRILQVGQCLPKTCLTNDIHQILNADPAGGTLRDSLRYNDFEVLKVRKVPGDLDLMNDWRFQFFL